MRRHRLATRLWHWITFVALAIMFMSGLNISNAHPHLYWGQWGFEAKDSWLDVIHFPGWATIPGYYSLAQARHWHLLFAWVLALSLLIFMLVSLVNGHFRRDLVTRQREWRWQAIRKDVGAHLRLDFTHPGTKFSFLQKLSYGIVIFILLPLMIFTGLTISPGMDANWHWLPEIFGGRQSARSIHFIITWTLCAFFIVHILLVLLSGPVGQMRDMITGGRK